MKHKEDQLQGKVVDVTPLFEQAGIDTGIIKIIETPGMYPYKEKIEDNWAYFTAVGLKRLKDLLDKEGVTVRDVGIIGICSGVEGIAVYYVFKNQLRRLIVTDIDAEILNGTIINLRSAIKDVSVELIPIVGSFCEPIEQSGFYVDFVHGNIPNLPSTGTEDLSKGAEKGTFLPSCLYEGYNPPLEFVRWALGAQFAYLESAKKVLKKSGSVVTELGGRMPLDIVHDMFRECGFMLQEVIVGFKEQTEALIDFMGYHRIEKEYGVTFEFYVYDESQNVLTKQGLSNPTHEATGDEIKKLLDNYKVSAGEAAELYHKDVAVGHTVHLFRGVKNK